jgi:CheY-like chemotaxis protein
MPTLIPHALIIDDDAISSDILAQLLRYIGIQADIAPDGETAIGMLTQQTYQFAVVDLLLPKMDGWELLKKLRENPAHADMPVFSLTAYYDSVLALKAQRAGFTACYPKPANPSIVQDMQAIVNNSNRPPDSLWQWQHHFIY